MSSPRITIAAVTLFAIGFAAPSTAVGQQVRDHPLISRFPGSENHLLYPSTVKLSKQRAEAVVNALVSDHSFAAARFIANGVGPLVPVASNAAEDGRAKNRRVELVAQ